MKNKTENRARINMEGNEILPNGIDGVRRHLGLVNPDDFVDDVPLRVQMFCDVDSNSTKKMF
jgi:hypothetical protein